MVLNQVMRKRGLNMPKYDFKCEKCGRVVEIRMRTTQFDETVCDKCGGKMKRLFPTNIHFHNKLWVKSKVQKKMKKMGVY